MHIECTHSFMFNKKRVDWMYTFIYIFQKLCVLTIRNYIPSLKNVYIQSTRLWAFNYKSFFYFYFYFFLGMKIIQVECTQLCIFLEKKCINWTYIITSKKINSFLSTVMALDPSQKTNTSFACYDLLRIGIVT